MSVLYYYVDTIRFVNLEGRPKQTKRGVAEIRFEIKPDSVGMEHSYYYY